MMYKLSMVCNAGSWMMSKLFFMLKLTLTNEYNIRSITSYSISSSSTYYTCDVYTPVISTEVSTSVSTFDSTVMWTLYVKAVQEVNNNKSGVDGRWLGAAGGSLVNG